MTTGLYSDIAQYALVLPVIDRHINYHILLRTFEEKLCYSYNDRLLLQVCYKPIGTHTLYLNSSILDAIGNGKLACPFNGGVLC